MIDATTGLTVNSPIRMPKGAHEVKRLWPTQGAMDNLNLGVPYIVTSDIKEVHKDARCPIIFVLNNKPEEWPVLTEMEGEPGQVDFDEHMDSSTMKMVAGYRFTLSGTESNFQASLLATTIFPTLGIPIHIVIPVLDEQPQDQPDGYDETQPTHEAGADGRWYPTEGFVDSVRSLHAEDRLVFVNQADAEGRMVHAHHVLWGKHIA